MGKLNITTLGKPHRSPNASKTNNPKSIMTTAAIIAKFQNSLNPDLEYGLAEIKKILSDSFKAVNAENAPVKVKKEKKLDANGNEKAKKPRVKRDRDADGNIVKKRPPSAYNLFVAEKINIIRGENPGIDSKEVFKMAIALWNKAKGEAKANEPIADNNDDDIEIDEPAEPVIEKANEPDTEIQIVNDDDGVPTFAPKKTAKKGRKPKIVADDRE